MAEPVLSEEEAQALMDALKEGEPKQREQVVTEIDLTGGERPLRAAQPMLDKLGPSLAGSWRRTLATTYRMSGEVLSDPTEIVSFGEFRRRLEAGLMVARLEAVSSGAPVFFWLGPEFVATVVDYGFGGGGEDAAAMLDREPTALERNLLRRLVMILASDINASWRGETNLEVSFLHFEGRHDAAGLLAETAALLAVPFRTNYGGKQDELGLAFTAGAVDNLARGAARDQPSAQRAPDADLLRHLRDWPVWLSAELGRCDLTVDQLLELQPGTVLRLQAPANEPVQVLVNGVPKLRGMPVVARGNIAMEINNWNDAEKEKNDGTE
jgi:flagellar motor switch protein FliM